MGRTRVGVSAGSRRRLCLVAYDLAALELDDALAHLVHDARVVGRHHHGGAGAVDPVEQLHDADAGGRVEISGRLVGDEDHRLVDEGARDRDALLLPSGELVGHPVGLAVEADQLERLGDALGDLVAGVPGHLHREGDVLGDVLVLQQAEVLEDGADLAAQRGTFQPASRLISLPAT